MSTRISPAHVETFLKGMNYPVSKSALVQYAQQHGAVANITAALQKLPDQTFHSPIDVSKAIGELDREEGASPIHALSEANQTLAENHAAAQERNLKYAQSVFESTIGLLKSHVESARSLLEQWEQEAQKRQGGSRTAETYLSLFRAPLDAYQRVLETMESASKQSLESFEKATESFEKAMQRGREHWQEAMQQAQRHTGKPEK